MVLTKSLICSTTIEQDSSTPAILEELLKNWVKPWT